MNPEKNNSLIQLISEQVKGEVIGQDNAAFESAAKIWNGAVRTTPAVIVQCTSTQDVQQTVRIATEQRVPISVRGGGHDWAGRSLCDSGITIDLRSLRGVSVNIENQTVTVEGGATIGDVLGALPDDMVVVTGTAKQVGMAGLTLGGGYGPLNGLFGLALDNLISAEVVLADGSLVTASESGDTDLFWAIRGGGGNFGVLTSFTLRMHRVPQVLGALIMFPLPHAAATLRRYQQLLDQAPDELGLLAGFLTGMDGNPMLFIAPHWSGERRRGDHMLQGLTGLDGAITVHQAWSPYAASLGIFDPLVVNGRQHFIETRTLKRLDDLSINALLEGASRMTSPTSGIVIHDFHGAATRIPTNSTAFPLREEHLVIEIISAWDDVSSETDKKHRDWARNLSQDLAARALPGGYVNLLSAEDQARARLFYGETASRLRLTKKRLDPENLFRSAVGAIY
jgi:FAD/FMN-containing dehydrogenase